MTAKLKKILFSPTTDIKSLQVDNCFVRVTLDTRHEYKLRKMHICVTFFISGNSQTLYYPLPYKVTREEYEAIAKATGKGRHSNSGSNLYQTKKAILEEFDKIVARLTTFKKRNVLTPESIKLFLKGKAEISFLQLWQQVNNSKKLGTKISYEQGRTSFMKYVGDTDRSMITEEDVRKWVSGMEKDGLSEATIGMYLRSCKVAWKEAERKGLVSAEAYPFAKGKIRIPKGRTRRRQRLSVDQMTILYEILLNRNYPDGWKEDQIEKTHRALGLFLFQYLGNGCNLADAAYLRYGGDYIESGGKIFVFERRKTEGRSQQEVVIPITPYLKAVLDALGSVPIDGELVFPFLLGTALTPEKQRARVAQGNEDVRDDLRQLTTALGWTVRPSGTWARHSFISNLTFEGAPEHYIKEAVGHAIRSVTDNYRDVYPLELQMKYNSLLLRPKSASSSPAMKEVPADEYEAFVKWKASKRK